MASFLYRLSPREFIRMGTSLPLLPHRFMVKVETLNTPATSRTVNRSGNESRFNVAIMLPSDIEISTLIGTCQEHLFHPYITSLLCCININEQISI